MGGVKSLVLCASVFDIWKRIKSKLGLNFAHAKVTTMMTGHCYVITKSVFFSSRWLFTGPNQKASQD